MEDKLIDLIAEIFKLAIKVENQTEWRTSVSYSGHYHVTVYLHKEGWKYEDYIKAEIEVPYSKAEWRKGIRTIERSIQKAQSVIYQFRRILRKKDVNYNRLEESKRVEIDYYF